MKINTVLYTKNGKDIGNAIITDVEGEVYELTTDYGNVIRLNKSKIEKLFYIGGEARPDHIYYKIVEKLTLYKMTASCVADVIDLASEMPARV